MNWHKFVNDVHCSQKMYPLDFGHSLTSDQLCQHIHFIWEHLIFLMKFLVYIISYIFSLTPDDKGLGPDIHGSRWLPQHHQQIALFFFFDGLALNLVQMPWNFLSYHQHVIVFVQSTYPVKYLNIYSGNWHKIWHILDPQRLYPLELVDSQTSLIFTTAMLTF